MTPGRVLLIGADMLDLAIGPHREVVVRLRGLEKDAGLVPGLGVALNLSPAEARRLAAALSRTADKAEEGLPRA